MNELPFGYRLLRVGAYAVISPPPLRYLSRRSNSRSAARPYRRPAGASTFGNLIPCADSPDSRAATQVLAWPVSSLGGPISELEQKFYMAEKRPTARLALIRKPEAANFSTQVDEVVLLERLQRA